MSQKMKMWGKTFPAENKNPEKLSIKQFKEIYYHFRFVSVFLGGLNTTFRKSSS